MARQLFTTRCWWHQKGLGSNRAVLEVNHVKGTKLPCILLGLYFTFPNSSKALRLPVIMAEIKSLNEELTTRTRRDKGSFWPPSVPPCPEPKGQERNLDKLLGSYVLQQLPWYPGSWAQRRLSTALHGVSSFYKLPVPSSISKKYSMYLKRRKAERQRTWTASMRVSAWWAVCFCQMMGAAG